MQIVSIDILVEMPLMDLTRLMINYQLQFLTVWQQKKVKKCWRWLIKLMKILRWQMELMKLNIVKRICIITIVMATKIIISISTWVKISQDYKITNTNEQKIARSCFLNIIFNIYYLQCHYGIATFQSDTVNSN